MFRGVVDKWALRNGLEKCRKRNDETPDGTLTVSLPIKVQTGGDTWSMSGVKRKNGTQILIAEFTGYVCGYNHRVRSVTFE